MKRILIFLMLFYFVIFWCFAEEITKDGELQNNFQFIPELSLPAVGIYDANQAIFVNDSSYTKSSFDWMQTNIRLTPYRSTETQPWVPIVGVTLGIAAVVVLMVLFAVALG